jgi:hypothetical protein
MQDDSVVSIFLVVFAVLATIIYVTPTFIAFRRRHPNRWIILLVNVVFGGTILGWGIALIWALKAIHRPGSTTGGGESGLNVFINDIKKVQMVEPPPLPQTSASQELERLHKLFTQGAISQTEFDGLKAKLIQSPV